MRSSTQSRVPFFSLVRMVSVSSIAAGAEIQSEILPLAVHRQFPDGGKVCLLRFRQIIQQGADGTYQRSVLQHLGLDRFAEALLYACGTVRGVKTPCLIIRKHDAPLFSQSAALAQRRAPTLRITSRGA